MFFVASNYSKAQEEDLRRFNSDATSPLTGGIPMTTRDPWGPPAAQFRGHEKKDSSASDVSTDQLYPNDYNHQYPHNAYTQEPQPTPGYNYQYQSDAIPRAQPPFGESHGSAKFSSRFVHLLIPRIQLKVHSIERHRGYINLSLLNPTILATGNIFKDGLLQWTLYICVVYRPFTSHFLSHLP